jgi:hypothetical protein
MPHFSYRLRAIRPFLRLLGSLAVLLGASVRADVNLQGNQLTAAGRFTIIDPTGHGANLPEFSNETGNLIPPFTSSIPVSSSYTDDHVSMFGSAGASMSAQNLTPDGAQVIQSGNSYAQAATIVSSWRSLTETVSSDFLYFTLTTAYDFQLHEQATVSGDYTAGVEGYLTREGKTVFLWAASTPGGAGVATRDVTLTGTLGAGLYFLAFDDVSIALSSGDPSYLSTDQTSGSQTFTLTPVPEPSTFILLGTGIVGIVGQTWRRRRTR